jgi:hypothetical protein
MLVNKRNIRTWLRAATLIEQSYRPAQFHPLSETPAKSGVSAASLARLENRINLAVARGWKVAYDQLKREYYSQLRAFRKQTKETLLKLKLPVPVVPRPSEIVRELIAIEQEFTDAGICFATKKLSASTDPIVLEDTHLGAFQISLDLTTLTPGSYPSYEVIALNPYPAVSAGDTTHPHVQHDHLCEGDARPAIQMALRQGRFFDFLQLVNNVLQTYNPSSAYVSLADWHDRGCCDCGQLADSDDGDCCSVCESWVCDSCWFNCNDCDQHHCSDCNLACSSCLADVCKSCVNSCPTCYAQFCADCFQPNQERCHHCEIPKTENDPPSETEDPAIAVHADGMGEVAAPA